MRSRQAVPRQAFIVDSEVYFGGYNFGDGNAQLDFRDMFDWTCG